MVQSPNKMCTICAFPIPISTFWLGFETNVTAKSLQIKNPLSLIEIRGLGMVARDGIEPPTRGFSVPFLYSVCGCVSVGYEGRWFGVCSICAV